MSATTRKGKVARLPFEIREQVCELIRDGHTAAELNAFLIAQGHKPVNDQNWTNWRQGGYQDWLKEQTRLDVIRDKHETIRRELEAGGFSVLDKAIYDVATSLADADIDPTKAAAAIATLKTAVTGDKRANISERRVQIAEEALTIAKKKFQRETCELFLKWCEDQRAVEIAAAPGDSAEKMELLGKLIFKEDW